MLLLLFSLNLDVGAQPPPDNGTQPPPDNGTQPPPDNGTQPPPDAIEEGDEVAEVRDRIGWADQAFQLRGSQEDYDRVMEADDPEAEFRAIQPPPDNGTQPPPDTTWVPPSLVRLRTQPRTAVG